MVWYRFGTDARSEWAWRCESARAAL